MGLTQSQFAERLGLNIELRWRAWKGVRQKIMQVTTLAVKYLSSHGIQKERKEKMRGEGRIFQRGAIWWIAYSRNGHEYRETADTSERKARKCLQQRLDEIKNPEFVGPSEKALGSWTIWKKRSRRITPVTGGAQLGQ